MGIWAVILGTKARYAVMAMVDLATRPSGVPVALSDLADSQEIALPYLEQIFARLKNSGLIKSQRGVNGGYVLARPAAEIRISDIIRASEENLKMTRCEEKSGGCMASRAKCLTHDLWEGLEDQINYYLYGITLADIRNQKLLRVEAHAPRITPHEPRRVYLDYNATAPVRPEVLAIMSEIMCVPSNSSSIHGFGRKAKKILEDSRKIIAESINAFANEIIFVSSGSEANAMALRGFSERKLIVSAIEHSSVMNNCGNNQKPAIIPVDSYGIVDAVALDKMLADCPTALVSVMLANNETGVIQPIREVADICKKHGALIHCDAVQALGKIEIDFSLLGVDMMSIAAHKMGGAVGAAALIVKQNLAINPLITGGGQELRRRAGTENIAAIAGFAKAVEMIDYQQMQKLRGFLDVMEKQLKEKGAIILPDSTNRLPNTSCIALSRFSQEVLLMKLDLAGFAVSAGSACSSGRIETSHVLKAMKIPDEISSSAIRISAGWNSKEEEITSITKTISKMM